MIVANLPPTGLGGAEIQAIRLSKKLKASGVDITVITWGKIWHKRKGMIDGIEYYRLKSFLNMILDLPSLLKRKKDQKNKAIKIEYDDRTDQTNVVTSKVWGGMILRYQLFYLDALIFLWMRRKRFDIIHVHAMEWPAIVGVKLGKVLHKKVLIKDSTMNGLQNILRYPAGESKQKLITGNAWFVAMTRVIAHNMAAAGVPASRMAVIPNGIGIKPYTNRREWTKKVIFVGNLTQQPAKGIDILLKAWIHVIASVPEATLLIVGKGNIASYNSYVEQLNISASVEFLGSQNNVSGLLADSDIFVLPSRREGMSNALMEAMVAGMPIVATDISGNQDLIEHRTSGILVPAADVISISDALIYLLNNPKIALAMGKAAYERISTLCDLNIVTDKYRRLYLEMMEDDKEAQ